MWDCWAEASPYCGHRAQKGFIRGESCGAVFYHPGMDVSMAVHGDDFRLCGLKEDLLAVQGWMREWCEVKVRGMMGSDPEDCKEIEIKDGTNANGRRLLCRLNTHENLKRVQKLWNTNLQEGIRNSENAEHLEMVFYCGTGWRSSLTWVLAETLGFRSRNLDGGLYEWLSEGNDVELGLQCAELVSHQLC